MLKCIITHKLEPKINYFAAVYWYCVSRQEWSNYVLKGNKIQAVDLMLSQICSCSRTVTSEVKNLLKFPVKDNPSIWPQKNWL